MLDWLGDVTSTVSFCQLSGGVCYPMNLCINCMLCMEAYQTYDSVKLCILVSLLNDFCPGILSMFNLLFLYRV